jgi:hypothetical protein
MEGGGKVGGRMEGDGRWRVGRLEGGWKVGGRMEGRGRLEGWRVGGKLLGLPSSSVSLSCMPSMLSDRSSADESESR